jgi:hypothetical protein
MEMNGLVKGTACVSQNDVFVNYLMAPDKMRMDMHMLMAMYGISDRLTVMSMFNYSVNSMEMSMFPTETMNMPGMTMNSVSASSSMTSSGMSDFKIHFMYGIIKKSKNQLLLSLGLSLPTGSVKLLGTSTDMMYASKRLPYSMQLGSGTFDFLPCVNYLFQTNKLTFSTQISSTIRSTVNTIGYKLGNEVISNSWVSYKWLRGFSSSLRVEGAVLGSILGNDQTLYKFNELSANPANYGGKRVNGFIGSSFQFETGILKNNRLSIEYCVPIYQNLNGVQMKNNHSLFLSWSYRF